MSTITVPDHHQPGKGVQRAISFPLRRIHDLTLLNFYLWGYTCFVDFINFERFKKNEGK
jgi:hypothetical protein